METSSGISSNNGSGSENVTGGGSGNGRIALTNIAAEAYRHPLDRQASAALRRVPGFEMAVSRISKHSFEHLLYVESCASSIKVTERQCGDIHALLAEACRVLDVPQPALFLSQTPIANAFALGREKPTIVLQTGLVELLTEEELLSVIAHELGHIHCGHSTYRLMLVLLSMLARFGGGPPGMGEMFSLSLQAALLEWSRKAEFSADRAALLVTQNPETVFSALFKLTGGSPKIFAQMDRGEYLKQAEEYDRPDDSRLDKVFKTLLAVSQTHPIPVLRAREALRWGESDEYRTILAGNYLRREEVPAAEASGIKWPRFGKAESSGGGVSDGGAPGTSLANETRTCPGCGGETDAAFSFCTTCGRDLTERKVEGGGGSDA